MQIRPARQDGFNYTNIKKKNYKLMRIPKE